MTMSDPDWFGRIGSRRATDARARSSRASYEEELAQLVARSLGVADPTGITTLAELDRLDLCPPCRLVVTRATSLGTCSAAELVLKLARSPLAAALREASDAAADHDEDRIVVAVFKWPYVAKFVTLREEREDLLLPAVADGEVSWSLSVPYTPKQGDPRWLVLEPLASYTARWRWSDA
jgi:hypothetical protein